MLRRLLDSPTTYFVLAGLLFVVLVLTQFELKMPAREKGGPDDIAKLAERDDTNVIFVVIDTLRGDRVHANGYERETSPVMDYLANTGIRFSHVIAQSSWTKTSMASLWTSTWPRRNGLTRYNHTVPEEVEMPAELLQKAGFRTAGLWRNGWVAPNFGFAQGFQTYLKPIPSQGPERFERKTPSAAAIQGTDEDLTQAAQEFLRAFGNQRFFLYVHYMDVHQYAYDEISGKFGTSYSDNYDNAIHWVDRNVGVLVQELAERELWKKTVLVVVSDHGEGFREHGEEGHARTLFREVTHVPWIIALPFEIESGVVVDQTVGNVDVWPTLFGLLGMPQPEGVDGRNLMPLVMAAARGEPLPAGPPAYFAQLDRYWGRPTKAPSPFVSVTTDRWRLIDPIHDAGVEHAPEVRQRMLFDRGEDPLEQKNLAEGPESQIPPEVEQALQGYLGETTPPWGTAPPERKLEQMELNQLRALGYVIQ